MAVVNIRSGAAYDVYIGRAGRGQRGPWGNPFRVADYGSAGATLPHYEQWLKQQIRAGAITLPALAALHGKTLGCFCKPGPCHGDVLERAAAWAHTQLQQR